MKLQVNNITIRSWKKKIISDCSFLTEFDSNLAIYGLGGEELRLVLMCLAGCLKPDGGSVYFDGKDIYRYLDIYKKMVGIGEIKKVNELIYELTLGENIELVCLAKGELFNREDWLLVLEKLGIEKYIDTLVDDCDLWVRSLLGTICAWVGNPRLIFLDEPAGDLNVEDKEKFWTKLKSVNENKLIVFTTRDKREVVWMEAKLIDLGRK